MSAGSRDAVIDREDIAVVGLSGRFPGARSVDALWRNLRDGVESIRSFTPGQLAACGVDPAVLDDPTYVNAGAVLEDAEWFAASFFGYSPREADLLDPQHRVFLECAWEALEDAGCDPARFPGAISVYAGVALNGYFQNNLVGRPELSPLMGQFQLTLGNEKDFVATRVAYKLNLRGASMTVQTGCSTSLVATHLACQALLSGECDMALVGGGRIRVPLHAGYHYVEGGVPSPDGHCRAFDAEAAGCIMGSGMAVVALKRLSDARRDGDVVHAVLRGSATNNDGGDKIGFTAPSVSGQVAVISQALAMAGVDADSIDYVETHGTGTPLGDAIEIAALARAFRSSAGRTGRRWIGSVKTNIGHLDAGAGVAGLIKTVLAVRDGVIPPSLNFRTPNPQIDFTKSPFDVNTTLRAWPDGRRPRRAGVSSFGIGGTNAHVVVEQAPAGAASDPTRGVQILVLSAKSRPALERMSGNLADAIRRDPALELGDVAFTLQLGRSQFAERRVVVASTAAEAAAWLDDGDPQHVQTWTSEQEDPPVAFLLPGGGAQYPRMGQELYEREPVYREALDECFASAQTRVDFDLRALMFPAEGELAGAALELQRPTRSLPALFATEYALAKLLMGMGIRPAALIGHSMGEYVAACLAGVITPDEGMALVVRRGELFERLPEGGMLSVPLPESELSALIGPGLSIGAVNGPDLCMASGPVAAIAELEAALARQGIEGNRLHISVAAHSAMLDPMLAEFEAFCRTVPFRRPSLPFISNVTGRWITDEEATDPMYWVRHLRQMVRFADGMGTLLEDTNLVCVEVGPGRTLAGFARLQAPKRHVLTSMRHAREESSDSVRLLEAVGKLWLLGCRIDWQALHHDGRRCRVVLPTYPFERTRHWIDPVAVKRPAVPSALASTAALAAAATTTATTASASPGLPTGDHRAEPPAPLAAAPSVEPRRPRLVRELQQLLHEMSGVEIASLDPHAPFLALGFDSLFLTQANVAFQRTFKVRTTFRQLFDQTPTIDALAGFIDAALPAEVPSPATAAASTAGPATTGVAVVSAPAPGGTPFDQLAAQLQAVAAQLEALRAGPGAPGPAAPSPSTLVAATTPAVPAAAGPEVSTPAKAHGPFKPIDKTAGKLPGAQHAHLDALIERYCRKTAGSKALTQHQRRHLADPRSVSGFRQIWKELVYQIAVTRSSGSRLWDIDGNEYVDVTMGFSVNLFGFSPDFVTRALEAQLERGIEIGVLAPLTETVADAICEITGVDRVCFVNTGSEANMAAIRAARTATGRDKIAVFAGSYHGIFDEVLVKPVTVRGQRKSMPVAPGIPASMQEHITILDYGDPASIEYLRREGHEYAGVFVEPVQTRHPDLQPREFLHALREVTREVGAALIFDEVVTGFRLHPRGAQGWYGVDADLVSYGKLIGGGMPMAVVAGKARFMDVFDGGMWQFGDDSFPEVGVTFFGGTFVKHPLALAASAAVLAHLKAAGPELHETLNRRAAAFATELNGYFTASGLPLHLERGGSIFNLTFAGADEQARLLFVHLRDRGVHIYDRPFSISTAHTDADLAFIIRAFKDSLREMQDAGFFGTSSPAPQAPRPDAFPLTEPQLEVWLGCQWSQTASLVFNESSLVALRGKLNLPALTRAVQGLVDRHDSLRTTFAGDGMIQRVAAPAPVDLHVTDLSALTEPDRRERRDAIVRAEGETAFDLERGPLARFQLVKLADDEHELIIGCHHLVCDGVSFGVLNHELAALYVAACRDQPPALPPVTTFRDYVAWQADESRQEDAVAHEAYWTSRFADRPAVLDLPGDRPRPAMPTYRGAVETMTVSGPLWKELRQFASRSGNTAFGVLVTGYATLLHRLTGQDDIVIGMPMSGQAEMGSASLVGHCVNFLPLRIAAARSLHEQLGVVRATLLDAFDHRNYTLGRLIRQLKLPRDAARVPLVNVTFTLDPKSKGLEAGDVTMSARGAAKRFVNVDLHLNVNEVEDGIRLDCAYMTDIYDAGTVRRWLASYVAILEALAGGEDRPLGAVRLSDEVERQRLLSEWNRTDVAYPLDRCLFEFIEDQVARTPDAPAVAFEGQTLTYAELNARANQLAAWLRRRGVGAESLVAVCMERSAEMVVALVGVIKSGGAYVPLDPHYPAERLAVLVDDLERPLVLTQDRFQAQLPPGTSTLALDTDWHSVSGESPENLPGLTDSSNAAYVIYTSGSTGRPKGAVNIHRGIVNRLLWGQETYGLEPDDRVLQKTPYTFDVSVWEFFWPLMTGACLVVARPEGHRDPAYLVRTIEREAITTVHFVPSMLGAFLDAPGLENLRSLRRILCSGEALPLDLQNRVFERLPHVDLHNLYGPTEASVEVTAWTCRPDSPFGVVPIGKPIANTQIYLLDEASEPVPVGVSGELYIGGVGVARGYLRRPELTTDRFVPDPFRPAPGARLYRTGDLARFLPDGNIEFLGRLDFQVKIRGLRIELGEIETALRAEAGVREAVVVAYDDAGTGKRLVAYVAGGPGDDALRIALKRVLPEYMVPSVFVAMDALPLTSSGKIDRKALPPPPSPSARPAEAFVAPATDLERALAGVWAEVLHVPRVGADDDFFELGGHSLLAIQLIGRLRDLFGVELPPHALLGAPTVRLLAEAIAHARRGTQPAEARIPRRGAEGPGPLSFAQERLWFLDQLNPDSPAYNVLGVFRLGPPVDPAVVRRAVAELVRRHDVLRTVFVSEEGEPAQIVLADVDVSVAFVDLTGLDAGQRDDEWTAIARAENRRRFDLSRGPLVRATLVQLTPDEHVLLLALHHIVVDEWSLGVIEDELGELCRAYRADREPSLPAPPIRYADFAAWQRERLQGPVRDDLVDFWKGALAGAPLALEVPADHARPPMQTFRGAVEVFELPADLLTSVRALGRQEKATVFMTVLAGFMALLHRITGQRDLLVGTPIAGRTERETERIVGLFLNTIVLRGTVAVGMTFRALVQQIRERAQAAYQHQELPFEQVVAELVSGRDPSRTPIFQVMFLLYDAAETAEAARASTIPIVANGTSKFDLTLGVTETKAGLEGWVEYSTDLFEASTIRRFVGYFQTVLDAAVRRPDAPITTLPLMSAEERARLLSAGQGASLGEGLDAEAVPALLEALARHPGEATAVVCGGARLTYRDLDRQSNRLARHLIECGVGPEALVGLALERSADMLVALLAVLKAGGAYVPLDPAFPADRLDFMVRDSELGVLIAHRGLDARFADPSVTAIRLDTDAKAIADRSDDPVAVTVTPAHLAYVLYTSGSTGTPKGVAVSRGALENLLNSMRREPGFSSSDVLLAVTTLSFDIAGLELLLPLVSGGAVVIAERDDVADPAQLGRLIETSGCTVMQATPSLWRALVDSGWRGSPGLKLLCGGEALPSDLAGDLLARSAELWNMYGPTETTIWSACGRVTDASRIDLGGPIDRTELLVLDDAGALVPVGVPGQLHIGGDGLARGYHGRPDLTAERFVAHPFRPGAKVYRTGDRVRWRSGGGLEFLGRDDQQVKVRGFRVEIGEIEAALRTHPSVHQAVVVLSEDTPGDQRIVAYAEGPDLDPADLREHLRRTLPEYFLPNAFVRITSWPITPNGKIDRARLPAPADEGAVMSSGYVEPASATERRLAAVWQDLLRVPSVGARDDFFLLGGHSLLAVRLVDRVHRTFGVALAPADLFRHPTLGALAALIEGKLPRAAPRDPDVLVRMEKGGSGTPFFWVHGIGGEVFSFMQVSKHLAEARPVYGFAADWSEIPVEGALTVEHMAATYVSVMRQHQPRGPYHLGGFCSGSMIALEMARQLEADGQAVGVVAAVDWDLEAAAGRTLGPRTAAFLRNVPRWIREDALPSGLGNLVGRLGSQWRHRFGGRAGQNGDGPHRDIRDRLGMWHFPDHQVPMLELHHRTIATYVPKPIAARVVLFLPRVAPLLGPWPAERGQGWKPYAAGGVEVHLLAGSHATLLSARYAPVLARRLNQCLDRAERGLSERPAAVGGRLGRDPGNQPGVGIPA